MEFEEFVCKVALVFFNGGPVLYPLSVICGLELPLFGPFTPPSKRDPRKVNIRLSREVWEKHEKAPFFSSFAVVVTIPFYLVTLVPHFSRRLFTS